MTKKTEPDAAPVKQGTPALTPEATPTPEPTHELDNAERPRTGGAFVRQKDGTLVPEEPVEEA